MRPRTVAEACARGTSPASFNRAISEFLDEFYAETDENVRVAMLAEEPQLLGDPRLDALVAGLTEYLFKKWTPGFPPEWIGEPHRYLKMPWFPSAGGVAGVEEYLTWCSPPEFKSRNIMTDARPFRRASMRS